MPQITPYLPSYRLVRAFGLALACTALAPLAHAASPAELLANYAAQAKTAGVAARGQQFFNSTHGKEWRCASCHGTEPTQTGKHAATGKPIGGGTEPTQTGKHAATGKPIGALAPAFNAERFTDAAKTEKWFRRNCNDVAGRECTAAEKADILSWLMTLKP